MSVDELDIKKVINEDLIDLNLEAATKLEAIEQLIHLLYLNHCINDEKDFLEDVLNREKEGITGLGEGVAIPHGKSESVIRTSLAIGRTQKPIEWESLDGKPISTIILFAVKNTDSNVLHIKLLQRVAILLADDDVIAKFQTVRTKQELIDLLSKK
ncbi:PTS sugar transporter subunit IIA [Sporolactobacillus sp. STSJ-5]|uniref:PTS sugar transporter subunit IIA n=1 Tax=Sporolactobacillus sp. STSJ-5 TaxID=2965076 RepID=UPI002106EF5E|nr:PTS sugar transporter subunit IIA [Sporolactobacillus sp. STSJ-5]MCQ2009491.1 PTS sugar transporter subunit IIA [Sporolactobacillus sp. STSJ-5]